jgi:tRNA pseudouridine-54 N-methylase
LREYIKQSDSIIDRKNKKLKELIEYIRTLHQFLAYLNENPEDIEKFNIQPQPDFVQQPVVLHEYEDVEEVEVPLAADRS